VANRGDKWGEVVNPKTSQHPSQLTSKSDTQHSSTTPFLPAAAMRQEC